MVFQWSESKVAFVEIHRPPQDAKKEKVKMMNYENLKNDEKDFVAGAIAIAMDEKKEEWHRALRKAARKGKSHVKFSINGEGYLIPLRICRAIFATVEIGLVSLTRHEVSLVRTMKANPMKFAPIVEIARKFPDREFGIEDSNGKMGVQFYKGARIVELFNKAA